MPGRFPPRLPLALGLIAALLTASCSRIAVNRPVTDPVAERAPDEPAANATTPAAPSTSVFVAPSRDEGETVADLELAWADTRARVVERLAAGDYGVDDDNVLVGPDDFAIDLDDCPTGWSDTAGIGPESIELAVVAAETGDYRSFSDIALGMGLYFDYVNSTGGIDGRTIELTVIDDAYDGELAAGAIAEIVVSEEQPLYATTVGTPGSISTYGLFDAGCVPQPFAVSPHPAFADPVGHPFTTGFQLAHTTEALLWGAWIKDNLQGIVPVDVGALVIDNDFGAVYADTFRAWADENRDVVRDVVVVRHDPTALTVSPEISELAEAEPDVFIAMTAGQPCLSSVVEAARAGITGSAAATITASGCRQPATYQVPAGADSNGLLAVVGGVESTQRPSARRRAVRTVHQRPSRRRRHRPGPRAHRRRVRPIRLGTCRASPHRRCVAGRVASLERTAGPAVARPRPSDGHRWRPVRNVGSARRLPDRGRTLRALRRRGRAVASRRLARPRRGHATLPMGCERLPVADRVAEVRDRCPAETPPPGRTRRRRRRSPRRARRR